MKVKKKKKNLLVKSNPAQKLPRHRKSAHLCGITLLEGNSPLLFQVIILKKKKLFGFSFNQTTFKLGTST